jgi:lysophospholipase L1-like esterase
MIKIFKILVFVFVNLFLLELVLSIFDPEMVLVKSFDKELLFSLYPNKEGRVVSEEFSITIRTNQNGFRQTSPPITKTILLGDSFSEGWGVNENENFVNLLNDKLDTEKKILNLGVHGSSPILYALQLPHFIEKYKPTTVIIQLFDNDLDDNEKLERFILTDPNGNVIGVKENLLVKMLGATVHNFIKETSTYRLVQKIVKAANKIPAPILYYKIGKEPKFTQITHAESIQKYGNLATLGDKISTAYNGQFEFYAQSSSDKWKTRLFKNKIYLEQIVSLCKENNIQVKFLYIPAKEFFAKGGITGQILSTDIDEYNRNNPFYLQIKDTCEAHNLQCAYLNNLFFFEDTESLYFPFDAHLNFRGHQLLSEKLYKEFYQ